MRKYILANSKYFIHRVGDPPDMVHPCVCFDGPMDKTPMLMEKDEAEVAVEILNEAFAPMKVSFEPCLLHPPNGPRSRTLNVIGHEKTNHIFLRDPAKRVPEWQDDWGDEMTVGIHLQSKDGNKHFGSVTALFMRIAGKCIVVGPKNIVEEPMCEVFYPSLQHAQQDWECD